MNVILRSLLLFFCLSTVVCLFGQAPQGINYQAAIRTSSGQTVPNQNIGLKLVIRQGSIGGSLVYEETHTTITNSLGIVNVVLGTGSSLTGQFSDINWGNGPYWVEVSADLNGGSSYSVLGAQQLMSVPYALYAERAGTTADGNIFSHFIGEEFGGGVIFHLWFDENGIEHGLIVSKLDVSNGIVWSNIINPAVGFTAQSTWDGLSNSNAIVSQQGHNQSAAKICLDWNNSGQTDWYLPSTDEILLLMNNRYNVNRSLAQIAGSLPIGFNKKYWTSSEPETSNGGAWCYDINSIGFLERNKTDNTVSVRAIRAF